MITKLRHKKLERCRTQLYSGNLAPPLEYFKTTKIRTFEPL